MNRLTITLTATIVIALAGCASTPPANQVRLVAKAFDNLNAATQPLLDDLALAERAQGKRVALARARLNGAEPAAQPTGTTSVAPATASVQRCPKVQLIEFDAAAGIPPVQNDFCPEDSAYWSELSDPPGTLAFRRALAAVGDYTQLLLLLGENRNVDEALGQLQILSGNLGTALEAVGAGGVNATLGGALVALKPLLTLAAQNANAKELERVVRQEAPKVDALMAALREQSLPLFRTLTGQSRRLLTTEGDAHPDLAKAEAARMEGYRVAVSNYVVLLGQYQNLLRDLVMVYDQPHPASLADLAERSARLSAQADAWRRSLAALRTGLQ